MNLNYVANDIINIIALVVLKILLNQSVILNKSKRHIFTLTIYSTILIILMQIGTTLTDNNLPKYRAYSILFNTIGFILSPLVPVFISFILCEKTRIKKLISLIPTFINAVFVLLSPIFGLIFSVSENNEYSRGSFFFVFIVCFMSNLAITIVSVWMPTNKCYLKSKLTQNVIVVFTLLGTIIQSAIPFIHTTWTTATCGLVLYYALLCEQNDKLDSQTHMLNRKTFEEELKRLEKRKEGTFIIFDVDNFKYINDNYGHPFGDEILVTISELITRCFDSVGPSFRIGGDEFATICYTSEKNRINNILKQFDKELQQKISNDNRIPNVSYGYKFFSEKSQDDSINSIVQEADELLYKNKEFNKQNRLEV